MIQILNCLSALMLMLASGPQAELHSGSTLLIDGEPTPQAKAWTDSVYNSLTEEQRVAQLFIPHMVIHDNEAGRATMRRMVKNLGVGGILLGKGTVDSYAALINLGQSEAKVPLLVTLDGEWGLAMRLSDAPRFPYNIALGAITDTRLLYDYGRELARECRALGIQVDFAPDMDVNSNPDNPVIGFRSFGEDPHRVAKAGVAMAKGMEAAGVMSVSKHFPGHGDTGTDSHKALPTINHSMRQLETIDFVPFREYIDAGLSGVMVGHLNVPVLDPGGAPASLSGKVVTDLLRGKMGFRGLIFTDALEMKGAVSPSGGNNCVVALQAGVDVLLGSANPAADIKAVMAAVESGRISKSVIEERCKRMLAYKYELGLTGRQKINTAGLAKTINSQYAADLNQQLANAAITVTANKNRLIPIPGLEANKIVVVSIGASADNEFSDLCRKYIGCEAFGVDKNGLGANVLTAVKEADIVIAGVMSDKAFAVEAFRKLTSSAKNLVPAFFVSPFRMRGFGALNTLPEMMLAYDNTPSLRRAAAMALFGGIDISGHMPVDIKSVAPLGAGETIAKSRLGYASPQFMGFKPGLESTIDSIVKSDIRAKAMPGCQVLVAREGEIVLDKCYGTMKMNGTVPVTNETLYDIASMSKATASLAGIMKAVDEGLIKTGDKVSTYIPELKGTDKENLTINELLYHESGMPATLNMLKVMMDTATYTGPITKARYSAQYPHKVSRNLYGNRDARLRTDITSPTKSDEFYIEIAKGIYANDAAYDTIMQRIYRVPLRRNKNYTYSCLNFALLTEAVQRQTGVSLDQWADTEIFGPLGANRTGYRPLEFYPREKIAPTEQDNFLRKQLVQGYVHDEMAAFSGGVLGNAGLFSTAVDLAKLCQMYLNGGSYGDRQILSEKTVENFMTARSPSGRRGAGFDLASGMKSTSDTGASPATVGHTGFTGTCFWIDPEHELIYIFLSNRVNPTRDNAEWTRLKPRTEIMAAIYNHL